jgi:glutamine amidotransferase-like uncharacterized protein
VRPHRNPITPIIGFFAFVGCAPHIPRPAPILLFNGTGTSSNDVAAIESILRDNHLDYSTANSRELCTLGPGEYPKYRLVIIPGGNFIVMGNHLTPGATSNLRDAVANGLNYLGICAGAFLAGDLPQNSVNLTSGVRFPFYSVVNRGVMKAAVPITFPTMPASDQYWESGPELSGWGDVVARYPDGTPAIAQRAVGKGWVLLSGFHPEAPESWRSGMKFRTRTADSHAYALTLIRAALDATPLPHY